MRSTRLALMGAVFGATALAAAGGRAGIGAARAHDTQSQQPEISFALKHDTSGPLRGVSVQASKPGPDRNIPLRVPARIFSRGKIDGGPDPALPQFPALLATPLPLVNFAGQSDDDNAAVLGFRIVPPDTNGDVGPNHYVQFINLILQVFDKTGGSVFGPVAGNSVWDGFGGICEANNDGDPIVLYDHLADRWLVSQFAIGEGDDGHQCVAISQTGDPTGAYHRYDFGMGGPGHANDYPKLGVWPDGYYMTANEFDGNFQGPIAVAFERDQMLTGAPARMVKFGPLPCADECPFSLQPSHLNGVPPPAGTPNTFLMSWDDETWGTGTKPDGYRLWNFHVDWVDPAASSLTALPQVDTPEFDANLCNYRPCAAQPRGERLDTLSQFTMYRAQFRNFGAYSTLVVNHTVDVTGRNRAGVRWAELRNAGAGWTLYQTGTVGPDDGHHRWLGSAAMDAAGNLALGYSISSRTLHPSIRYVARQPGDPLGTMGSEVELVAGGGSQQASFSRWGDYASMSVDPVDNCTFWFTSEYYANAGSFDFKTRIGAFRVPGC